MNLLFDAIIPGALVIVLVGVVAFFAASETAFLSISKLTIRQMLKKDPPGKKNTPARKIAYLKKDMNKLLSLILIGINFVTSLASGLATTVAINLAGAAGSAYATVVMVFILIIFGEITPKTFSSVYPVQAASKFAVPLIVLQKLLFPIVWIFARISGFFTIVLNALWKNDRNLVTEEELKSLIEVGETEGTLEHSETKMLYKIFDFTDLHIHDIMRHRSTVQFIPLDADYNEVVNIFTRTGYSRIPVCDREKGFEDVRGMIYYKHVLFKSGTNSKKASRQFAQKCMRPVVFVPETMMATELLAKFKKERVNFAVAVDETGCNAGIVTMDDILRAVFGRSVSDENNEIPPENRIQPISPVEYIVPGDMRLDDVNELLDMDLDSEEYDTLGGWLLEQFDALPETGEVIKRGDVVYKIEDQSRRRIQSVRINLPQPPLREGIK